METELSTITRRLKRLDPLQMGKMLGALYGIMGLMFIPFVLIMSVASSAMPTEQRMGFAGFGIVFGFIAPVLYGALGFVFGLVGALLYNVLAKWLGGIEFELE